MTRPSKEDIQVSLEELRREASIWKKVDDSLRQIAPLVSVLDWNAVQMGIFAPAHEAYHGVCEKVATVSKEGADEAKGISSLLDEIARVYEKEERRQADAAQSIHEKYGKW